MATYLLRINWENTLTGESADRVVWGYHVDAAAAPSASALITAFAGALDSVVAAKGALQTAYITDSAQVYDVVNGGPPVDEALFLTDAIQGSGVPGPQEVQACISRWVLDGLGRPFKKGRTYFGPISGVEMNGHSRPRPTMVTGILDFQSALHENFIFNGWEPVVDTKGALHVPLPIVQYSVDDAWDTQRRRGVDPTADTTRIPPSSPLAP